MLLPSHYSYRYQMAPFCHSNGTSGCQYLLPNSFLPFEGLVIPARDLNRKGRTGSDVVLRLVSW